MGGMGGTRKGSSSCHRFLFLMMPMTVKEAPVGYLAQLPGHSGPSCRPVRVWVTVPVVGLVFAVDDRRPGHSARRDAMLRGASPWPAAVGQLEELREDGGASVPGTEKQRNSQTQ